MCVFVIIVLMLRKNGLYLYFRALQHLLFERVKSQTNRLSDEQEVINSIQAFLLYLAVKLMIGILFIDTRQILGLV